MTFARPRGFGFYASPGDSIPHNIVIYLGGDKVLQAPATGQKVRHVLGVSGQTATVRRIIEPW